MKETKIKLVNFFSSILAIMGATMSLTQGQPIKNIGYDPLAEHEGVK